MFVPILAPIAWYLGNKANNEIQSSGIHYTDEQNISVGRMLGKIFTIIAASAIVLWVVIAAVEAIQGSLNMPMLAGHVDLDELDQWARVSWERRRGGRIPTPTATTGALWWMAERRDWWGRDAVLTSAVDPCC